MGREGELVALEHEGWASLADGTAADFYAHLMADDGIVVLADGSAMDRSAVETSLRESPGWDRYELTDVRVLPLGADAAAVVYRGRAWRDPEPQPFEAQMTSVYRRADGAWQLVLYQQTPQPVIEAESEGSSR